MKANRRSIREKSKILSVTTQEEKYIKCSKLHVPTQKTAEALGVSEKGEGHRVHKSMDELFKFLEI